MFSSSSKNDETLLLNIVNKSISDDLVNMKEPIMKDRKDKKVDVLFQEPDIKVSLVVTCCPVPNNGECSKNEECDCSKNGDCSKDSKNCDCCKASNASIYSFFTRWFACTCCCDKKEIVEPIV